MKSLLGSRGSSSLLIVMFSLKAVLRGHTEDVRGVCVCPLGIVTGSRDKTVKLWTPTPDGSSFECSKTFVGHTDFVGPVAFHTGTGQILSGSRDMSVICWDPITAEPSAVLTGHEYQVAALAVAPNGDIVSGSLDKTVKVWRDGQCATTLTGHESSVLSLAATDDGTLASGSGDTTIRIWRDGACQAVLKGHTDTVRALSFHPGIGLISGSHDQSICIWDKSSGTKLHTMVGHTAIIYAVQPSPEGLFLASGAEDNTARIWVVEGGDNVQVIEHPGCVWDVAFTPDGELVTACSDGRAYLWTTDHNQAAGAAIVKDFEERLAAFKSQKSASEAQGAAQGGGEAMLPAGLKMSDRSVILQPGDKDGKIVVVKENGVPTVYSWSANLGEWEKIGEVTGGQGGGGPGMHNGVQYDYVFDVDIEDGAPPKKLAVNRGDNPYTVADNFLMDNDLPAGYRDQIVQFILRNTDGAVSANQANAGQFVDPFTGASAYVPRATGGAASSAPLNNYSVTGGGADPYTGTAAAASAPAPPSAPLVPLRMPVLFEAPPPLEGLLKKLREFAQGAAAGKLSVDEFESSVVPAITRVCGPPNALPLPSDQLASLLKLLAWPPQCLFPVFDALRQLAIVKDGAKYLLQAQGPGGEAPEALLLGALKAALDGSAAGGSAALQTACKLLANLSGSPEARERFLLPHAEELLGFLGAAMTAVGASGDKSKNVRLFVATVLLDFAVVWHSKGLSSAASPGIGERKLQSLALLSELLQVCPAAESDAIGRALVAVGTMCLGDGEAQATASDFSIAEAVRGIINASSDARVKQAGNETLKAMGRG